MLALILADNTVLDRVVRLEPDHFYDLAYREVFVAARDLRTERERVNLVTLGGRMGGDPLGGKAIVLESLRAWSFAGELPDAQDIANSLMMLAMRRQMQAIGHRLADSVWEYQTKPADVIEGTMRELDALLASTRPPKRTSWDFESGMDDMLRGMDADVSDKFISTGIKSVDALTGGMRRGDLTFLGGRPNMGKTAIGLSIVVNAGKAGHGVLFHSLEMDKDAVLMRVASEAAYTPQRQLKYSDALRGRLTQVQKEAFARAALSRARLPILMDERSGLSLMDIAAETRKRPSILRTHGQETGARCRRSPRQDPTKQELPRQQDQRDWRDLRGPEASR